MDVRSDNVCKRNRADRPRVLVIAEAANPEWVSVPLVGWSLARALAAVADVHVVTQARNRGAILRAGWVESKQFTAIDSEAVAAPLWKLSEKLRGGAGTGWTTVAAMAWPSYVWFEHLLWRQLGSRIAAREWDLVHRVTPLSPTLPSFIASKLAGASIPFVIGPLNGGTPWPPAFTALRRTEREWLSYVRDAYRLLPGFRQTRQQASAIILASRATWVETPTRWHDRTIYIPENGIDLERFSARPNLPCREVLHLSFVGRLVPYKGADMVLDAAAELLRSGRARLDIVGDGPQLPALREQVGRLGVEPSVCFHGWQSHQRVAELLADSDLFVFPSIREFGGGAVLEAMACSVPPLVVEYGGPAEIVSPSTGYTVDIGTRAQIVAQLRSRLEHIIAHPEELAAKATAARLRVERHFTWTKKAEQVLRVYDWVLGRSERPSFPMPFTD